MQHAVMLISHICHILTVMIVGLQEHDSIQAPPGLFLPVMHGAGEQLNPSQPLRRHCPLFLPHCSEPPALEQQAATKQEGSERAMQLVTGAVMQYALPAMNLTSDDPIGKHHRARSHISGTRHGMCCRKDTINQQDKCIEGPAECFSVISMHTKAMQPFLSAHHWPLCCSILQHHHHDYFNQRNMRDIIWVAIITCCIRINQVRKWGWLGGARCASSTKCSNSMSKSNSSGAFSSIILHSIVQQPRRRISNMAAGNVCGMNDVMCIVRV